MAKAIYPAIKKALWVAWRTFFVAFGTVLTAQIQAGIDIKDFKAWATNVAISATAAGVKAVFKWLREKYGQNDYTKLIFKLPA